MHSIEKLTEVAQHAIDNGYTGDLGILFESCEEFELGIPSIIVEGSENDDTDPLLSVVEDIALALLARKTA